MVEIIAKNVVLGNDAMLCGSYEAEVRTYQKVVDRNGHVWLIANQPNRADNVYHHDPRDKNSRGFAGRTLSFAIDDGTVYEAMGPWHTNSQALFEATGVDVRETHSTICAIGLKLGDSYMSVGDVFYLEKEYVLGRYERYEAIAERFANELQRPVYYNMRSQGGGSGGWSYPDGYTDEQKKAFFEELKNGKV